jgi:methyl-accepting chemotaxis protein
MVDINSLIALFIAIPALIGAAAGTISGVFNFLGHHTNRKDIIDLNSKVQVALTKSEELAKQVSSHSTQIADAVQVGAQMTGQSRRLDEHAADIDNLTKTVNDITAKVGQLGKDIPAA